MDIVADLHLDFENAQDIGSEGKNSQVSLARDLQLDTELAVKIIDAQRWENIDSYLQEARILYRAKHQNIVEVMYACIKDNLVFMAMPYYQKGSLSSLMRKRFLTVREVIRYGLDFLTALHSIHVKKLIHFDIKPNNILLDDSDKALLSDFGLAKYMIEGDLATQPILYTAHRPPESFLTDILNAKSDIYQSGITLYRMCNGDATFEAQVQSLNHQQTPLYKALKQKKFPDKNAYLPHIPKELSRVVNKAMSFAPDKRQSSIIELMNQLSSIGSNDNDKNGFLDWQHTLTDPDTQAWSRSDEDHKKTVVLERNRGTGEFTLVSRKQRLGSSAPPRRSTENCRENLGPERLDAYKFVSEVLMRF